MNTSKTRKPVFVEGDVLYVKTSPGGMGFRRGPDGRYSQTVIHPPGSFSPTVVTPLQVAERVLSNELGVDASALLQHMGWSDVQEHYLRLAAEKLQKSRDEDSLPQGEPPSEQAGAIRTPESEMHALRQLVQKMEPLYKAGRHEDYQWWRDEIYRRLEESPGFNPEDVSVRRMHFEALAGMAWLRKYPENRMRLDALESQSLAPASTVPPSSAAPNL